MAKKETKTKSESLTVKQATDAHQVLAALIEVDKANKFVLASSVRIKLALNQRKLKPVAETFVEEQNKLVEKHGEKEVVVQKVDGVDKPVETGKFIIKVDSPNREAFQAEYSDLVKADSGVVLNAITPWELAGVTKEVYEDPKSDPKNQNQVPTEIVGFLFEVGILVE